MNRKKINLNLAIILAITVIGFSCNKDERCLIGIEGEYKGIENCGGISKEILINLTKSSFPNNVDFVIEGLPEFRGMYSVNRELVTDLTLLTNTAIPMKVEGEFRISEKRMEGELVNLDGEMCSYSVEKE